jgi:hypothetical protein
VANISTTGPRTYLRCCLHVQVRLNLLPALLEEAYAHMQACLSASLLGRKLFVQPFHRDVSVTPEVVAAMRSSMTYCKQVGGQPGSIMIMCWY